MARGFASLFGLLVLGAACSNASETPATKVVPADVTAKLESTLDQTMAQYGVPGAAVAVCAPGYERRVIVKGVADKAKGTPVTGDLVWPLRSVTKSFTVTLVLQLVDEKKVSLEDPISKWVQRVPNGDKITLRMLADMTSGVPDYTTKAFIDAYSANPNRKFTTLELIDFAIVNPPVFDPGTRAEYANAATLLLGQAVEGIAGQPFAAVVDEKIAKPLKLASTRYPTEIGDWSGPHPTGYQPKTDGTLEAQDNNFSVFGPAGAMTSTLEDLCRWGTALGTGELLAKPTAAARLPGRKLEKGPEYDTYGQGIGIVNDWVGHTGEGIGFTALVMHSPKNGANAVVVMNISTVGKHVPTQYFRAISQTLDGL